MEIPLSQEYINMSQEDSRGQTEVLDQARPGKVSSSSSGFAYARPPTSEGHNSFFRTPFWVFLDSMEIPSSQDSIHVPVGNIG